MHAIAPLQALELVKWKYHQRAVSESIKVFLLRERTSKKDVKCFISFVLSINWHQRERMKTTILLVNNDCNLPSKSHESEIHSGVIC
jgi:hypothetical protein